VDADLLRLDESFAAAEAYLVRRSASHNGDIFLPSRIATIWAIVRWSRTSGIASRTLAIVRADYAGLDARHKADKPSGSHKRSGHWPVKRADHQTDLYLGREARQHMAATRTLLALDDASHAQTTPDAIIGLLRNDVHMVVDFYAALTGGISDGRLRPVA
jgi:hypothetical protein